MANTYSQSHVHVVMAVRNRAALIGPSFQERMHQYMTGAAQNQGHRLLAINSMPDHLHAVLGMGLHQAPSDFMRIWKGDTSEWINKSGLCPERFNWQGGFGWFHLDRSRLYPVIDYVMHQQEHHRNVPFRQEYMGLLNEENVPFDPRYIFRDPE
ncbi:transposase [Flaviaesturariibacter flavus]|uniref:Transposase n=1 Tax=Flaviaesturariibacter flavus TaxID=2502780 RepID=A0A4R1B5G5_9BACT|nr:transposase [Flaviaesturariibacter flavus]TCJ13374.1 transposase [Flaviaesturariibacter flavus]